MSDETDSNSGPPERPSRATGDDRTPDEAGELRRELQLREWEIEIQDRELHAARGDLELALERFRELYDNAPVGYLTFSANGHLISGNLKAAQLLGVTRAALGGMRFYRFVTDADRSVFFNHRRILLETGARQSCELRMVTGSGSAFHARLESVPATGADGEPAYRTAVTDVSAHVAISRAWHLADAIIEATDQGLFVTDVHWRVLRVNRAFTAITGFPEDAVYGKTADTILDPDTARERITALGDSLRRDGKWSGELMCLREDGSWFPAWSSLTTLHEANGAVTHFAGFLIDITESRRNRERIDYLAHHDEITGLPNRALFLERLTLASQMARRHGKLVALLFVDLDRFKQVNDELGHAAGDAVLRAVARRLVASVRESDTVARIGGDEFAVVLGDVVQPEDATSVAEAIIARLDEPIDTEGTVLSCGASIGVALHPRDTEDLGLLRRFADMAMYRAKTDGRNRYHVYTNDMMLTVRAHHRIQNEVDAALHGGEFTLCYQPIIASASGRFAGAEALVRWNHPDQGILLPDRFLNVCEETHQIQHLGQWVFATACAELATWSRDDQFVTINLSPRELRDADHLDRLLTIPRTMGLASERVVVEISENATIEDVTAGLETLVSLRRAGMRLALDDFGTGYTAMRYLKRFPIDMVKIDRSFVAEIEHSIDTAQLVEAMIGFARGLGIQVVAEGVETQAQADLLTRFGSDYLQGYWLSRPLTLTSLQSSNRTT